MQTADEPVHTKQAQRLQLAIARAKQITLAHREKLDAVRDRYHVRPTASGLTLVSIHHKTPQLGWAYRSVEKLLHDLGKRPAVSPKKAREKKLRSALIRNAYANGRHLRMVEEASTQSDEPVQLLFVSDELALPIGNKRHVVCDMLALRVDGGRSRPVLLELKSNREKTRLLEQLEGYAKVMTEHSALFAQFYGAVLGREVRFDDLPPERWIVWPQAPGHAIDPQEDELRSAKPPVRVVSYTGDGPEYSLRVGNAVPA